MKRRLNIACAIVHKPKLIIFDEPTVGIDPQSRNNILETIYISSIPGLKEEIIEGLNAEDSEFVPENEVDWN